MSAFRPPSIRHIINGPSTCLRVQRRWARVHDVRFHATHSDPQERILSKYREKLDRKAKEEGASDILELKERYQDKIKELKGKAAVPGATAPLSEGIPQPPPPPSQPASEQSRQPTPSQQALKTAAAAKAVTNPPGVKTLSSYIDVEKTRELPHKEVEYIWRLRHAHDPNSLCAIIPSRIWSTIANTAKRHPQFILPLPNPDPEQGGASIHFLQWNFPTESTAIVLFTHLAEYKLRGEFATPHTTVTHHLDLQHDKGVVLVQGNVMEGRGVSVDEGKWLLMCLQKFYGLQGEGEMGVGRRELLEQFSKGDGGFSVERLLEEAEKVA
ncbi:hypothetical protein LTS18_005748 [Coniosporium uncinatum]|uniref:Uncharacterized protein n=1 Tax=Coniosporium uncinatum TaxID=93489 RepID=A0ACC3D4A3_9PEZI|nr:hypothetical protein LTS18_005748 [Coniosporium uncinatum]